MGLTLRNLSKIALFLALCFAAFPSVAQQRDSSLSGSLVTTNDAVTFPISGAVWGTARWTVSTAGSATVTTEFSLDPSGVNWLASAYSRRTDAVSANPSVASWSNSAPVAGTFETPLPLGTFWFRVRCGNTGTATAVTVGDGTPYVAGALGLVAVLYDVTSGTAAANNTGTLDVSGWYVVEHTFTMSGGVPAFALAEVDDAGVALSNLVTSAAAFTGGLGEGVTIGGTAGTATAAAQIVLPRRVQYTSAAIAAQTSRVRVVARR